MTIPRDDPSLTNVGLIEALINDWLLEDSTSVQETVKMCEKAGMATISPVAYAWEYFFTWIHREEGPELDPSQITVDTFHWVMRNRFYVITTCHLPNYIGLRLEL